MSKVIIIRKKIYYLEYLTINMYRIDSQLSEITSYSFSMNKVLIIINKNTTLNILKFICMEQIFVCNPFLIERTKQKAKCKSQSNPTLSTTFKKNTSAPPQLFKGKKTVLGSSCQDQQKYCQTAGIQCTSNAFKAICFAAIESVSIIPILFQIMTMIL